MAVYLVDCKCGHQLKVDSTLAGGSTTCGACRETVDIPAFRELKSFPRAEASDAEQKLVGAKETNFTNNLGGVLLVLSLMAFVALIYLRFNSVTGATTEKTIDYKTHRIEHLLPAESLKLWQDIEEYGLGDRDGVSLPQIEERRVTVLYALMGLAAVAAATGFGMMVVGSRAAKPTSS
ncbi:MAG: hypothetical protein KDB14_20940 [Planctomycetales bacterium]|nr:hypothetical protein [Planctomycetales bacterium]